MDFPLYFQKTIQVGWRTFFLPQNCFNKNISMTKMLTLFFFFTKKHLFVCFFHEKILLKKNEKKWSQKMLIKNITNLFCLEHLYALTMDDIFWGSLLQSCYVFKETVYI